MAELILAYARDEVPDYQMAAWCMAVYFNGLSGAETFALTDAMIRSGDTLAIGAALGRKVVDKHSTGGVGDKTSISVGPIVAACGVPLGKMSGRGLGHTGGTLDKLESIPGFRVELTTDEMVAQLRDIGVAIVGQSAHLARGARRTSPESRPPPRAGLRQIAVIGRKLPRFGQERIPRGGIQRRLRRLLEQLVRNLQAVVGRLCLRIVVGERPAHLFQKRCQRRVARRGRLDDRRGRRLRWFGLHIADRADERRREPGGVRRD